MNRGPEKSNGGIHLVEYYTVKRVGSICVNQSKLKNTMTRAAWFLSERKNNERSIDLRWIESYVKVCIKYMSRQSYMVPSAAGRRWLHCRDWDKRDEKNFSLIRNSCLEAWTEDPWKSPWSLQGVFGVKIIFIITLRCYWPFFMPSTFAPMVQTQWCVKQLGLQHKL